MQEVGHVGKVHRTIPIYIRHLGDFHLVGHSMRFAFRCVKLEKEFIARDWRTIVAGGYKLFKTEGVKVQGEILEEVALVRVVAIAEDHLALEMVAVMLQLLGDVVHLRVELVLLRPFGVSEIAVFRHVDPCRYRDRNRKRTSQFPILYSPLGA